MEMFRHLRLTALVKVMPHEARHELSSWLKEGTQVVPTSVTP